MLSNKKKVAFSLATTQFENQGWVVQSRVSANPGLRQGKSYLLSWYLTQITANLSFNNSALRETNTRSNTDSDSCILCIDCPCNVAQSNSLQVDGVLVILNRLL